MKKRILAGLLLFLLPMRVEGFSQKFIDQIRMIQSEVLLDGQSFDEKDLAHCWVLFDEEVLEALREREPRQEKLNRKFGWASIEKERVNITPLKLGGVEAKFYPLKGDAWLVTYYFGYGTQPASTFRLFQKSGNGSKRYKRIFAFEEEDFVPGQERLQWTGLELTPDPKSPAERFSSFHLPPVAGGASNRSQIDWEWDGKSLKGVQYRPEVDWHLKDGKRLPGPGKVVKIK